MAIAPVVLLAGERKIRIRLESRGDDSTWVKRLDGVYLILFFCGRLGKDRWTFEKAALVGGRTTFSSSFQDLDLGDGCAEGVASDAISPLVFDRVVS